MEPQAQQTLALFGGMALLLIGGSFMVVAGGVAQYLSDKTRLERNKE